MYPFGSDRVASPSEMFGWQVSYLDIYLFCVCGCTPGQGGVSVSIEGASKADIECNDLGDGRCCVTYHPTAPGLYVINIHFAEQPLQGTLPVAPPGGEGGSFPSYGWTSKNYVICVCFHCHGTSSRITRQIHCKAVEQRAPLIHSQYNRDWGTSYSRPPIDTYLTSPLSQNPGGATVHY